MTDLTELHRADPHVSQHPNRLALTEVGWAGTIDRLDRVVTEAARAYLQDLRGGGAILDPLAWTRELDRLTRGRQLDYSRPGLPLMYAIRYMPKRVISLLGALVEVSAVQAPSTVTDIGSGTGAAIVAMQLLHPTSRLQLTGIDGSPEMLKVARHSQTYSRHPAVFIENTIEALIDDPSAISSSDLVSFSAPFDRAFDQWTPLVAALSGGATTAVLAAEPESRAFLLDGFQAALRSAGWETRRSGSASLPDFMKAERPLPALTRLWRQIGAPGAYQPQTWWEPPADDYLIARRPR